MNLFMRFTFTLAMSSLIIASANAKAERDSICEPREPKINYIQAITIAQKALVTSLSVKAAFIDFVELSCQNHEHLWTIGFRRKAYESGHLLIYIHMDGSTETTVVKDG